MEDKIVSENINRDEQKIVSSACSLFLGHSRYIQSNISNLVASLCDVNVLDMLKEPRKMPLVQARWFYWYVEKQMYGYTNEYISEMSKAYHHFKTSCVTQGISKMSMLIQSGTIWTKRWAIIKRVISVVNNVDEPDLFTQDITVKITYPKCVNIELKQE